jgi:hypothetical protein
MVIPDPHRRWLDAALPVLQTDDRLLGLAAGGSWLRGELDAWSDLDLVVLVRPEAWDALLPDREPLARRCGPLLSVFTAEHVGAPEMVIALYGPPLLHVDLKFTTAARLAERRVEDPAILWERAGALTAALGAGAPHWPAPDPQWLEDRFWTWIHYTACKLGRGELFETLSALEYLRGTVLAPLACRRAGVPAQGQRRLEQRCAADLDPLRRTLAPYDARALARALDATVAHYRALRAATAPPGLVRRTAAEQAVVAFLADPTLPR